VAATALERSRKSAHLERQLRESRGLLHTVTALAVGSSDQAWSELLRCAVEMVPGAEGGSIFVREGKAYRLVAQMGYDDRLLGAKVMMPIHRYWHPQPHAWLAGEPRIAKQDFLRQAVGFQDQFMDVASARLFEQWGRLKEIRCSLCLPVVLAGEVQGFINLDNFSNEQALDERSIRAARNYALQITALLAARREREEREAAYEGALRAIGVALEARDLETAGHTDRVARLAELLGQELGLDPSELRELRWGAYLHDLGKLTVPDSILAKPTGLDSEQRQVMQSHTTLGYRLTRHLPFLPETARLVVLHHHERWDGTGYPSGLKGQDIPLAARIFAVCDVFDALVSPRPYKEAWSIEQALAEVRSGAGSQFDPAVVAAFDRVVQKYPEALRLECLEPEGSHTR
jgi:putative nucleotidyltransferase with HDIG domain